MDASVQLGVASAPLAARLQGATEAALRGWSQRWGVEAACEVALADDTASATRVAPDPWLVEHAVQPGVRLSWPTRLAEALSHALYRTAHAAPAGTLAAESVRHVADDLLSRLAEAWFVQRWKEQDGPEDPAATHPVPARWRVMLDVRVIVAGVSLAASVPGLRLRAPAKPTPRPLTPSATVAAFASAQTSVEAVVGRAELSLGDVAHLQPGDVLLLDTRLPDPLSLSIAGGPVALPIALGTRDGARAVQLLPRHR